MKSFTARNPRVFSAVIRLALIKRLNNHWGRG